MNDATHESAPWITRRAALASAGGIGLLLAAHGFSRANAQDATPTGPVGVTMELLGAGQPATAPGLELTLRRVTIAPGGSIPAHSHPGALVFFVESGVSTYTLLGGTLHLTRAVADGTSAATEAVEIGTEIILQPGDSVFVEDPQDDAFNDGEEDLVLLFAGLTRQGEPFTMFMTDMEMETPAGTPQS